jgi:hypothetical protein
MHSNPHSLIIRSDLNPAKKYDKGYGKSIIRFDPFIPLFSEEGGKVLIDYHVASPRVSLDFLNLSLHLIK